MSLAPFTASSAAIIFGKSKSEYQDGLNAMSASNIEDKEAVYSKFKQLIDNSTYCESRHYYLLNKIKSLKADNSQKLPFLEKYRDIFNDTSCPFYVRAWAAGDSILHKIDQRAFEKRVNDAYRYVKKRKNTEEIIFITSSLAWAEYSLGNFYKSLALYNQLDDKRVIVNEKYIYNSEVLISTIKHYRKVVKNALETKKCNEYWNSGNSSKRNEKVIAKIINSYNELHDLANKGRRETTPVYENLSYSGKKIVVDYNVSPLLYKVQSAAERLAGKIKNVNPTFRTRLATIFVYIQEPESEQNHGLPGGELRVGISVFNAGISNIC